MIINATISSLSIAFSMLLLLAGTGSAPGQSETSKASGAQQQSSVQNRTIRRADSIKGRVVGEGGRPVADTSITAFPVNIASNPQVMVTSLLRPVSSNADGKFELTGLQPGAYSLIASSPGYVQSESEGELLYRPGENVTLTLIKGAVITGKVTSSIGDPVVGAVVRAIKIREVDNRVVAVRANRFSEISDIFSAVPFKTDDRGIYRIYGLAAGFYQVAAGGRGDLGFVVSGPAAYDSDAPTYYPSSTIDTASEIKLHAGDEAANIDIRYRDNRGRSISGNVSGDTGAGQAGISVLLSRASNGVSEATTFVLPGRKERSFAFEALLDGEYFVTAIAGPGGLTQAGDDLNVLVSQAQRVTLSGADVTGVELVLEPLGQIAGRAVFEPLPPIVQKDECRIRPQTHLQEVVIAARNEAKQTPEDLPLSALSALHRTAPNEKGEFILSLLRASVYRLGLQLPGDHLFVRSIVLPRPAPNSKPLDAAKTGIKLKTGEKAKGFIVTIGEGAAGLRGRVTIGEQDKAPSEKMRVHLVPAEPDAVDEVLRYYEAEVGVDGGFMLTSLAPGKYWLLAREVSDQEAGDSGSKPLAWEAGGRLGLRYEGESTKKIIELGWCQRVADYAVKYTPLIKPAKSPSRKPEQ